MQHHVPKSELALPDLRYGERHPMDDERWPAPVALLFIAASSATLWLAIIAAARLAFG